ncbi:MAG: tetratricopeptide repeat protein, partial [Gemmatimonadota bacterium]|nr:tetratricopeptide repeat protein [Gemmatimonadota bacterium]
LFTDIEGSTELWQSHGEAMPEAIARHEAILAETIESRGGRVFKTVGDAVHAAFDSAPDAVEAALEAQRRLRDADWPIPDPPAVRMALHAGPAERRDGDFYGLALNRTARIRSAGHGGQILLSSAVERRVGERFPEGAALRDLGERRLKDLTAPERIFQLVVDDLPTEFPRLATLDARPHNIPAQTTPLVGRDVELAAVRELLLDPHARLVTLVGPGGTGKTRLALQAAAEVIDAFADGVFLVNLAPIDDPDLVAGEILRVLDARPEGEESEAEALVRVIAARETLLVLDNFEQVVESAPLVAELLRAGPDLVVMVTSQIALRLQGEHEVPVPPLSIPELADPDPDRLASNEAVSLFVQRARAASPSFRLARENAAAVAGIVRELDGLPLAIELAAARIKLLPPARLLERLQGDYDLLSARGRDRPDRHRALRATIDWSFDLLDEEEKALFRRQAVFDGGYTLESAEAVCSAPDAEIDVFEGLESLVDKSLVRRVEVGGEIRFERLRTIRAYALEKLEECDDPARWRRRHAEHFAAFADGLDYASAGRADATELLDRLEREMDNLRAAFEWAIAEPDPSIAVRLTRALPAVWFTQGSLDEGRRWLERTLELGDALSPIERAHVINTLGRLGQVQGDNSPRVIGWFEESLELYRDAGHRSGEARALMNLGNVHRRLERFDRAGALFEEALEISRDLDDSLGVGGALMNLGEMATAKGDLERARELFLQARDACREGKNLIGLAYSLQYLGVLDCQDDAWERAGDRFEEARKIFERLNSVPGIAWSDYYEATLARKQGDVETARERYDAALARFRDTEFRPGIAAVLLGFAAVDAAAGECERAARLLGAAKALHERARTTMSPIEIEAIDEVSAGCREDLGDGRFEVLEEEGAAMELEVALGLVLATAA